MSDDAKIKERATLLREQRSRAAALDPVLLECRIGGSRHGWIRCQPHVEQPKGQLVMVHQCERCQTIKITWFGARWGELIARVYQYPKGYTLKREAGQEGPLLSPAAVRLTLAGVDPSTLPIVTPDFGGE